MAVACAGRRKHLEADHGRSYQRAFAAQRSSAPGAPRQAVSGLESQEAAIISDGYRASLAPKEVKVKDEPYIIVAPQTRDRPQQLAPSVPKS
jgi:hypothetical protein